MKLSKKNFIFLSFLLLVFAFLFFSLKKPKEIKASPGSGDNVWGWAWAGSPTSTPLEAGSGWISFNSKNCDSNGDGITDTGNYPNCPSGLSTQNYGVNIDSSSLKFSGRAWVGGGEEGGSSKRVLGWLSFERSETGAPPSDDPCSDGSCIAKVGDVDPAICDTNGNHKLDTQCGGDDSTDIGNYKQVFGWARFCGIPDGGSTVVCGGDGWDGWVKFSHFSPIVARRYGTTIDMIGTPNKEFKGWAWGSDIVGWISFNCSNQGVCGASNYKVLTSLVINHPPVAAISCHPNGCEGAAGACQGYSGTFCLKNASTDPDNNISNSVWTIKDSGGLTVQTRDCVATGLPPLCDMGTITLSAGVYTAQLDVVDAGGLSNTTSTSFNLLQDIIADFRCSLSPTGPWQNCQGFGVEEGVVVYFRDYSTPSTGATIDNRSWTFEDGNPATAGNVVVASSTFTKVDADSGKVTLWVHDTNNREDTQTYQLQLKLPLPKWKEIKP
jgi:hypothetical protein